MARTKLISYTGHGANDAETYAAKLLVFTKSTRLNMTADSWENICKMSMDEAIKELKYMATTIRSSWEFVDVTFLVERVSRACAQQMTRTRNASFAMQSLRVVEGSELTVENPFPGGSLESAAFYNGIECSRQHYKDLRAMGASAQDARGLLPLNTHCNLVCKYNLRAFVDLVTARESLRTQSEYRDIVMDMKDLLLSVWPWAESFFVSKHDMAISLLEEAVAELSLEVGHGPGWTVAKAIDLLRGDAS